ISVPSGDQRTVSTMPGICAAATRFPVHASTTITPSTNPPPSAIHRPSGDQSSLASGVQTAPYSGSNWASGDPPMGDAAASPWGSDVAPTKAAPKTTPPVTTTAANRRSGYHSDEPDNFHLTSIRI